MCAVAVVQSEWCLSDRFFFVTVRGVVHALVRCLDELSYCGSKLTPDGVSLRDRYS